MPQLKPNSGSLSGAKNESGECVTWLEPYIYMYIYIYIYIYIFISFRSNAGSIFDHVDSLLDKKRRIGEEIEEFRKYARMVRACIF